MTRGMCLGRNILNTQQNMEICMQFCTCTTEMFYKFSCFFVVVGIFVMNKCECRLRMTENMSSEANDPFTVVVAVVVKYATSR